MKKHRRPCARSKWPTKSRYKDGSSSGPPNKLWKPQRKRNQRSTPIRTLNDRPCQPGALWFNWSFEQAPQTHGLHMRRRTTVGRFTTKADLSAKAPTRTSEAVCHFLAQEQAAQWMLGPKPARVNERCKSSDQNDNYSMGLVRRRPTPMCECRARKLQYFDGFPSRTLERLQHLRVCGRDNSPLQVATGYLWARTTRERAKRKWIGVT